MRKGIPWNRSLASPFTGTIRQLAFRRCQRRLQRASCPAPSISSSMMTSWTSARQEGVEGYLVCYMWLIDFILWHIECPHVHTHIHAHTNSAHHACTHTPTQPGDRVQIVGTYRCLPFKRSGYTSGTFRTVLLACNVIVLSKEVTPLFSARDVAKIKRFSKNPRHSPFELLARSLAPSIHGHEYIKKAVLFMLLGGVEKILENGTRLRG